MALTELTENLNIHQSLPNQPTLDAEELKQEFDKGANLIKEYLNDTLLSELNTIITEIQSNNSTAEETIGKIQGILNKAVEDIETINNEFTAFKTKTTTDISTINNQLSKYQNGATTKISIGTSTPSSLANGEIYLQYFN